MLNQAASDRKGGWAASSPSLSRQAAWDFSVIHDLPRTHRLVAVAVSAALSALVIVPFIGQPLSPQQAMERVTWLQLLANPTEPARLESAASVRQPKSRTVEPEAINEPAAAAPQPATAVTLPATAPAAPTVSTAEAASSPSAATTKSAPAASAPLILTPEVIRRASTASKSEVRRMAEASGTALDSPRLSKDKQLAQDVASAVKPDCLGPGGSLLSVFVTAYQVARDKCK